MKVAMISETGAHTVRQSSQSPDCGKNNAQDHVKDDNADDISCGIRLLLMGTTLVRALEVFLGVRKSRRERALDVRRFRARGDGTLPNRLKLTASRRRLPIPTLQNRNGCCSARRTKPGLGKSGGVYLCTKHGYFGFSITGMALANRILGRTQCQFGCNRPISYEPHLRRVGREIMIIKPAMPSANWNHDSFAPYIRTGSKPPVNPFTAFWRTGR
ncbi:hypothetical protein K443DRAFT_3719 [Laccaria amethystina LaAM-08-1]|uniref:Uncharacterized protein n=1 Tax=Laccaria amethystina LaAM-08-1 TaxID=1095629 RepID=A0A0C9XVU1_9AGAR|nr:hypothetical protein K443DRAFT_3719 [Laccaria amethystina LaAM-08-1]